MGRILVNSVLLRAEEPPNFDCKLHYIICLQSCTYVYVAYGDELLLNLSVNSDCQNNPDLCPCIQVDNDCNVLGMANNKHCSIFTVTCI